MAEPDLQSLARGRSLGKINDISNFASKFQIQLNFNQISYFWVLLYFKFRGKFHKFFCLFSTLMMFFNFKGSLNTRKGQDR